MSTEYADKSWLINLINSLKYSIFKKASQLINKARNTLIAMRLEQLIV